MVTLSYKIFNLEIFNFKIMIDILIVININFTLKLGYSIFNIISLVKTDIKVFSYKTSPSSRIIVDNKLFSPANIIEN